MRHLPWLALAALSGLAVSCAAPEPATTTRDTSGNYATTSKFNSTQRNEFAAAMRAGLADFDRRRNELETRATKLGQTAIEEFHGHMPGLAELRNHLVNELARLDAALDKDWPERRADTEAAYDKLRKALDAAYADVLD